MSEDSMALRFSRSMCVIAAFSLLFACSDAAEHVPASLEDVPASWLAVDQFHDLYNAANYEEIWAGAGAAFQSSTRKEDFLELMSAMHDKLGLVRVFVLR